MTPAGGEGSEGAAGVAKGRLKFDVGDLKQIAAETGKFEMLLTNFPHNPTGACLNADEMHEVASVAHEHDAWLFSDEMYRGLGVQHHHENISKQFYQCSCHSDKSRCLVAKPIAFLLRDVGDQCFPQCEHSI